MLFVTGDTHGSYKRLRAYFRDKPVSRQDTLVILGDTGLNYHGDERDIPHKASAARLPLSLLCLRGNHDRRPKNMATAKAVSRFGGTVYVEDAYPGILFSEEGELYEIEGISLLAIGGAYSVDKEWRLTHGYNWFPDEQLNAEEKNVVEEKLGRKAWKVNTVVSHTCPLRFIPDEALFDTVDQASVDKGMEQWLDALERRLSYTNWFCGHFHTDTQKGPIRFLYRDVVRLV